VVRSNKIIAGTRNQFHEKDAIYLTSILFAIVSEIV